MLNWKDIAVPMVKSWESFEPVAYLPTPNDVPTIGYGRTERVKLGDTTTEEFEELYLTAQLSRTAEALEKELGSWAWSMYSPAWKAALVSLAYNVDKDVVGQLKHSKALKALQAWEWEEFMYQAFDKSVGFTKQKGKVLKGLVRRRRAEELLFKIGDFFDLERDLPRVLNT